MELDLLDLSEEELTLRVSEHLEVLALKTRAKGHIWILVTNNDQKIGNCSSNLKAYEWTMGELVAKAAEVPLDVARPQDPRGLRKSEDLQKLVKTKHVELHPIVAALVDALNTLNEHKTPRTKALKDATTVPSWFPFSAKKYAERFQKLEMRELFTVVDAVFDHIRGDGAKIRALRALLLKKAWDPLASGIGTWAGLKLFFDFLDAELQEQPEGGIAERQEKQAPGGVGPAAVEVEDKPKVEESSRPPGKRPRPPQSELPALFNAQRITGRLLDAFGLDEIRDDEIDKLLEEKVGQDPDFGHLDTIADAFYSEGVLSEGAPIVFHSGEQSINREHNLPPGAVPVPLFPASGNTPPESFRREWTARRRRQGRNSRPAPGGRFNLETGPPIYRTEDVTSVPALEEAGQAQQALGISSPEGSDVDMEVPGGVLDSDLSPPTAQQPPPVTPTQGGRRNRSQRGGQLVTNTWPAPAAINGSRLAEAPTGRVAQAPPGDAAPGQTPPHVNRMLGPGYNQAAAWEMIPPADGALPRGASPLHPSASLSDPSTLGHAEGSESPESFPRGPAQLSRSLALTERLVGVATRVSPRSKNNEYAAAPSFSPTPSLVSRAPDTPPSAATPPASKPRGGVTLSGLFWKGLARLGALPGPDRATGSGDNLSPTLRELSHSAPAGSPFLAPEKRDPKVPRPSHSARQPDTCPSADGVLSELPPGWHEEGEEKSEPFPMHRPYNAADSFKSEISVDEPIGPDSDECEMFPCSRQTADSDEDTEDGGVNGDTGEGEVDLESKLRLLRLSEVPVHTTPQKLGPGRVAVGPCIDSRNRREQAEYMETPDSVDLYKAPLPLGLAAARTGGEEGGVPEVAIILEAGCELGELQPAAKRIPAAFRFKAFEEMAKVETNGRGTAETKIGRETAETQFGRGTTETQFGRGTTETQFGRETVETKFGRGTAKTESNGRGTAGILLGPPLLSATSCTLWREQPATQVEPNDGPPGADSPSSLDGVDSPSSVLRGADSAQGGSPAAKLFTGALKTGPP